MFAIAPGKELMGPLPVSQLSALCLQAGNPCAVTRACTGGLALWSFFAVPDTFLELQTNLGHLP